MKLMGRLCLVAPAVVASWLALGWAGWTGGARPADAAGAAGVTVKGFIFTPAELKVSPGTAVTWTNQDEILHTATSGAPGAPDGTFNGTMDGAGTSFRHQFRQPGTYAYYCSRHESMTAKVVVG